MLWDLVHASAWITVVRFCCFRGLLFRSLRGGGGGVDNFQFAYIAQYRLRIPRYSQALASIKLESSGSRTGRNFMWSP